MAQDVVAPALYEHSVNVFNAMREQAQVDQLTTGAAEEGLVYEGFLTKLITEEVGLSVPYYTSVMRHLRRMGCVTQLRRGGSSTPSRWQLLEEPTLDRFLSDQDRSSTKVQRKSRLDRIEQRNNDMVSRVNDLEGQVDDLLLAMVALDQRVSQLSQSDSDK